MSTLRHRKPSSTLTVVKELDAFPKIPKSYKETTVSGGGVSILTFILIGFLVVTEVMYYSGTDLKFEYEVDKTFDEKMKINIDIVVAMKCKWLGADVIDMTGQRVETFGVLNEEPVHFELSPEQRRQFQMTQSLNDYIREEYHALHKLLWKTGYMGKNNQLPPREDNPRTPHDACRLHGTLTVHKVAGNFHVTAGKSVPLLPRGHAHLSMMVKDSDYNFSHRINHFSFGEPTPGIISPMDSLEKYAQSNYQMYQYFLQIVPTRVETTSSSVDTYQYAYTEKDRAINHKEGSHGIPGIFFKYDISSLKVTVKEEHKPYWQFLVRLCGIVGGIFATSGMLHGLIGFLVDAICCRYKLGKYGSAGIIAANHKSKTVPAIQNISNSAASMQLPSTSLLNPDNNIIQNPLLNPK